MANVAEDMRGLRFDRATNPALPSLSSPGVPEQECSFPGPLGDDSDGNRGRWLTVGVATASASFLMGEFFRYFFALTLAPSITLGLICQNAIPN